MNAKKLLSTALLAGSLFAPLITTPATASTEAHYSDSYQESTSQSTTVVSFLKENGVPEEKQKELLDRLTRGEIWDSMKGIEPISEVQTSDGKVISTYPDGSVAVFSFTDGDSMFSLATISKSPTPQEVSECQYINGHYASYWKNCKATWNYGTSYYTLRFNYQRDPGGWRISEYWEPLYRTYNGTVSGTQLVRQSHSHVVYYADFVSSNGASSWRVANHLHVHQSTAYTRNG